jgi:acyl-homoserine-lactone acylase
VRRTLALATVMALAAPVAAQAADAGFNAVIRRTAHGIPHVLANDWAGAGYGIGYAFAQDNLCTIADSYVTVAGERSKYFGPTASWRFEGNSSNANNLNSDFFYARINKNRVVEKLVDQPPPLGPLAAVKEGVKGYVAGYNRYLAETGVDNLPDPRCKGKPWVHPITEMDAYRRFYQLASLASQGVAIDGIGSAAPLLPGVGAQNASFAQLKDRLDLGIGSNAYGLGKDATDDGHGMVLGNPHFPWQGSERLYQMHITIPSAHVDVEGAGLYGVPLVLIGTTKNLAWSHTVSTARRFTPFQETLVPGSPTSYMRDGAVKQMTATTLTVKALVGGKLEDRSRTLYETDHGPIFTSILGLPLFPWTPIAAFAMGDANGGNFRYLNHFFEVDQAQSVGQLDAIERRYEGIPWVNTIAADSAGKAYYADIGAIPAVSTAKASACNTSLGIATLPLLGIAVLDGSRSACAWDTDPDAVAKGIFGPSHLPSLTRDDYVTNGNDSYWLSNPAHPLEGFARIIGDERTARSLRTRLGLRIVQQRLDGSDGLPGKRFTLQQLQDAVFNDRVYSAELWRDTLVAACKSNASALGSNGPVDVSAACPVLAAWDLKDDLDSRGAVLFRRIATRLLATPGGLPVSNPTTPYTVPFDVNDPVNTPRGLDGANPVVAQALADSVKELRDLRIPLDARLREYQLEERGGEKIPVPGGPGPLGVFNVITNPWNATTGGFPDVVHGSSFVMAAQPTGGCPRLRTIVTYSQSENPRSPFANDQTKMFSRKQWNAPGFCAEEVVSQKDLAVTELGCLLVDGLKGVRVRAAGRGLRVSLQRALRLPVRAEVWRVATAGAPLAPRRPVARLATTGGFRYSPRRALAAGTYILRLRARSESGRDDVREFGFSVSGGRTSVLPAHSARDRCGTLRSAALGGPVFGRALVVRYRLNAAATVTIELRKGRRLVRRVTRRRQPAGADRATSLNTAGLAAGAYSVRVKAAGALTITLRARRL